MLDQGTARIVNVADVGLDALVVHDEAAPDPSVAFALSRLASDRHSPTPVGVFRAVERPDYGAGVDAQLAAAQSEKGGGDLRGLLHSLPTWEVS
jgi:2-oxoglutarate ferredoxin oxidoreductase subunit beta